MYLKFSQRATYDWYQSYYLQPHAKLCGLEQIQQIALRTWVRSQYNLKIK